MSRGSGYGGGSAGSVTNTGVEMVGGGGSFQATGKTAINKKYFVTDFSQLQTAPKIDGFQATNITYTKINDTAYEQSVTYDSQTEGGNSETGGVVWLQKGVRGTFEMFCSFKNTPIGQHPRIDKLLADFGGYDDGSGPKWPPQYTPKTSTGLGGSAPQSNPMANTTHYMEATQTLRWTYFVKEISPEIWQNTGRITTKLPAGIPKPRGEKDKNGKEIPRSWMMQAPAVSRQGEAWQVIQEYVILNAKGVAEGMYEYASAVGSP